MKISFVIPAHNEAPLIGACLESILAEIAIFPCEHEIIVVDNASTDSTSEIAKKYAGVDVVLEIHKGTGWARQAGVQAARGDLIATIDADTTLTSGWLQRVITTFEKNPQIVGLSGPYYFSDAGWFVQAISFLFYIAAIVVHAINHNLKTGSVMIGGNAIIRKSALERIGGFNTNISFYGDDTDMAKRLRAIGIVKFDPQLIAISSPRRIHKEGLLRTGGKYLVNHFWVLIFHKPLTKRHEDIRE